MTKSRIEPQPDNKDLYQELEALDHTGAKIIAPIIQERPLTIFLNSREIVTLMTIGDYPDLLAVGYLFNQNMLSPDNEITAIDYEEDIATIVVRTHHETDFEQKLKRKIQTSGCGQGTIFGDLIETIENIKLSTDCQIKVSTLYPLLKIINQTPRLYLKTGAIHGCVLCQGDEPLIYMEDVGRHNAVDKIAGYMVLNNIEPDDKSFYTTGRLTSEMAIKTIKMEIPILISRSGFTAWAVELAKASNLTLIGRARGKRFVALSGFERIIFDDITPNSKAVKLRAKPKTETDQTDRQYTSPKYKFPLPEKIS